MTAHELIAEIIQRPASSIDQNAEFRHLEGWDSLRAVALILRLEQITGEPLSETEIETLESIRDLERLLKARA
jgi:acyl carrier protein